MDDAVTLIKPDDLVEAAGTAGIHRWLAVADEGLWAGVAQSAAAAASGWHHHSDNHTIVFLLEGRMRIEWGPGEGEWVEAEPGDFLHVPPHTVHREVNPTSSPARAIILRIGEGEPVVNVPGPDA